MPKTVLLADDSITIQHAVGISLANEDIALVNVNNGEDALIKARAIKPDLILLDVVMPKMSGYDVCKQVRMDPSIKHTPVILLVGVIEGFDDKRFKEAMANDYIIKPFESGDLINKIRKYLYPELSKATAPPKTAVQTVPKTTIPPAVIPGIPAPPVQTVDANKTDLAVPIPPKPVSPPVVPPVFPPPSTLPVVPPMPPHISNIENISEKKVQSTSEKGVQVTSFIDNLITPIDDKPQGQIEEIVDEISPQEVEEIASDVSDIAEKQLAENPPAVIDMVSQIIEGIKENGQASVEETATVDKGAPSQFNMDEWGVALKKEIMEDIKKIETAPVQVPNIEAFVTDIMGQKTDEDRRSQEEVKMEDKGEPMEVVSIAESITIEPTGAPINAVEVSSEPTLATQVEPTSLVEPAINLSGPIDEETKKYIREVIERVVWDVVPDLAERLIKEEIKRLMSEKEE